MSAMPPLSLRHLALWLTPSAFAPTVAFYREVLGMALHWQPDDDNVYLTSGSDNLALHRVPAGRTVVHEHGALDHLGFVVGDVAAVHAWFSRVTAAGAAIVAPPKTHRDGATSFYFRDPAGHLVQIIHIPELAGSHRAAD